MKTTIPGYLIRDWLERYLAAENFFGGPPIFDLPASLNRHVASLDEVEQVALRLREAWDLGLTPIKSLVEILEERGIKVGLVGGHHEDFDAITFWANENIPVIIIKYDTPGDRQRFNLAHELGHLVLEPTEAVDTEKAAYRFAGAFLLPEPIVRFELGDHRYSLSLYELHLLKHKYGLSMQTWIHRAKDLGILSESSAVQLFQEFRQRGWHRQEPGDEVPPEKPQRMKRLILRALAEDLISGSHAAELLGKPLTEFQLEENER